MKTLLLRTFLLFTSPLVLAGNGESDEKFLNFRIGCGDSDALELTLENRGLKAIVINPRFGVSTETFKDVEVFLNIRNESGERFKYKWVPRVLAPDKDDKLYLTPTIYIGTRISFKDLVNDYALKHDNYYIKAYYRNVFWNQKIKTANEAGLSSEHLLKENSDELWEQYFKIVYPEDDVVLRSNEISITVNNDNSVTCQHNDN